MPLTVMFLLAFCAFIATIVHLIGKCPLWVPVVLLSLYALLQTIPLGR